MHDAPEARRHLAAGILVAVGGRGSTHPAAVHKRCSCTGADPSLEQVERCQQFEQTKSNAAARKGHSGCMPCPSLEILNVLFAHRAILCVGLSSDVSAAQRGLGHKLLKIIE
jgi:hypothetical protein